MNRNDTSYDIVVVGSGPAGQNAALTAAECGARVLVIEREVEVGGSCLQYGTIPSKTLRETAVTLSAFKRRSGDVYDISHQPHLQMRSLMTRLSQVVQTHQKTTGRYLDAAGIDRIHGRAAFMSPHSLQIQFNSGADQTVHGDRIILATGSRPRNPPEIPVDHENILDSDSILSMTYLPQSLTVFGGGVIASEYAATFASLGVRVVMIDKYPTPLGFLDPDLATSFTREFERNGGRFLGDCNVRSVEWDGVSRVITTLDDDTVIQSDKALVAQGRVANTDWLALDTAGVTLSDRGLIHVNDQFQTEVGWIYAVGDAIGPPALASSSMQQGRSAAFHALGRPHPKQELVTPMGIYTIPEIGCVGLNEGQAIKEFGEVLVGRVDFQDLARAQIIAASGGMLKIVSDIQGKQVLGVQIVGDGATELVHLGQMAMMTSLTIDDLAASIFNFPTLAEAYRAAALDIIRQRKTELPARVTPVAADSL